MAIDHDFERSIYSHQAAASAGPLFESFADKALQRLDDVLAGRNVSFACTAQERRFLTMLRAHQSKGRVVPLGQFAEHLGTSPRMVKDLVQNLRLTYGVQVGASRESEGGGYYLCATPEESVESTGQMLRQAVSMLMVVSHMRGGCRNIDQFLTQLQLELAQEPTR